MAASTYFQRLRSLFRGHGDILTGFIVGAGLTKIYFESRAQSNDDSYSKIQIQRIINSHDNLKWGKRLRTISVLEENQTKSQNYGFQEESILKHGLPEKPTDEIMYKNHALCYDRAKRTPRWVAEHLTREKIKGEAEREKSEFKADLNIPAQFQAKNEDYLGSGWSRGHMTPASDSRFDQEAMDESFFLTNVVPQNFDNNCGFWYRVESYCRHLLRCYPDVYVISGPLYLPREENGSKFIRYQVIGENNVAVPTHLYKVILAEAEGKPPVFGAFVVPNEPIGYDHQLKDFQVPLEKLEKDSGLVFFPNFDTSTALDLCDADGCRLMSKEMMEMIIVGRRLRNSSSLDKLESIWSEMKDKGIQPDKFTIKIYEKRKAEMIGSYKNKVHSESVITERIHIENRLVADHRVQEKVEGIDNGVCRNQVNGLDDNFRLVGQKDGQVKAEKDVIIFVSSSSIGSSDTVTKTEGGTEGDKGAEI